MNSTVLHRRHCLLSWGLSLPLAVLGLGCESGVLPVTQIQTQSPSAAPAESALPAKGPLHFLERCLAWYDRQDIQGYTLLMEKQERLGGNLEPKEVIDVCFRAQPYSVLMRWRSGAREVSSVLYVEGENEGNMLVHPAGFAGEFIRVLPVNPEGKRARRATLYSIKDFGLRNTLVRTLDGWKEAAAKGTLHLEYRGLREIPELGNRPCYELRQTQAADDDGVTEVTIYIDRDTWFQVGTILKGKNGELFGRYLYRDIHLNPTFAPEQFTSASLTP